MGKATQEQINDWKKEYGHVFHIEIANVDIYFTTLTRDNYLDIMGKQGTIAGFDPEVETVKLCTLNEVPEDVLYKKGGIATVIHEDIMKRSGFVVVESEEL